MDNKNSLQSNFQNQTETNKTLKSSNKIVVIYKA